MHTPDHRHGEAPRRGHRPAPAEARDEREPNKVLELQRLVGNAATSRFVEFARRAEEAGEEPAVQRSSVDEVVASRGDSLPAEVKRVAEASYGDDFSGVRVHRDTVAVQSAKEFGARAYTSGEHVVMPPGSDDMHTWLHELDHVRQQRRGAVEGTDRGDGVQVSTPSDRHEKEADANATLALQGYAPPAGHRHTGHEHQEHAAAHSDDGAPAVQRSPATWAEEPTIKAVEQLQAGRPGPGQEQSFWPPIVALVQEYASLNSGNLDRRREVLTALETALSAWEQNQSTRGLLSLNRSQVDKKRQVITNLRVRMGWEDHEIELLEQQQAEQPSRTPSPAQGEVETGSTRSASPAQESSGDEEPIAAVEFASGKPSQLRRRLENVPALPDSINVHAHFTDDGNLQSIRMEGLRPGASEGIGLAPEAGGGPDRTHTYVVSGSPDALQYVTGEAGDGAVGVISSGVNFDRDANYSGGAYRYAGSMDPVRRAGRQAGGGPFSFPLPASAKDRQGIHTFVNAALTAAGQQPISEGQAYERLLAHLWRRMPLNMADAVTAALQDV
ncbi:protein of unknown function [Lentzea fradiae]|uniref:eCIS core domain-containing protein n=1 Tax=Lentzea fradiae TaxID=200378 RepID=A0A1G7LDS6_9PSEU|nr:DUF4157 domain-containing protein [Lentzea fradiae]SDF47623.1 protein of unknown function [Lentzea fradiae]